MDGIHERLSRPHSGQYTTTMLGRVLACMVVVVLSAGSATAAHAMAPSAIVAFSHAWTGVTGYSATISVFEQKGAQTQNMTFDYHFTKPSTLALRVLAGANTGATLAWNGGNTVVVRRGSGFLSLFRKTVSLDDPLVKTIRGSTIDELSFGAILAHSRQPGALSECPGEVIGGVATDSVTLVPASPAADADLTREVIEISTATHFPLRILGYEGSTLVRKIDIADVHLAH